MGTRATRDRAYLSLLYKECITMSSPVRAAEVEEKLGSPPDAAKTEGSERRSRSSCDAAYRSATYTLRGVT